MQGILLLLPGDRGTIPRARELREAGFTLSTALAPAGGMADRPASLPVGMGAGGAGAVQPGAAPAPVEAEEVSEEGYDNPARRMTSTHMSDRLKG